jgi:galactokinase
VTDAAAGIDGVLAAFARQFGGSPLAIASAAGRVNLIGEHTDYNGGEVLPIGIGRRTYVAVRPRPGGERQSHIVSANMEGVGEFDTVDPRRSGQWWDYVAGTVRQLRAAHVDVPAMNIAVWSDVPCGMGLSSSAALAVAATGALLAATGQEWTARDAALVAHRAEADFVGVPVGIMDQFASALARGGEALHIWCDTTAIEYVPFPDGVLIVDTGVERSLRAGAYAERRAECEQSFNFLREAYPELGLTSLAQATPDQVRGARLPDPLERRALHVAEETRRVRGAVEALRRGAAGWRAVGELLTASHASLRDLYECSTVELDWVVAHAMQLRGIHGARLTGAGWGGAAIAIGSLDALVEAAALLAADYQSRFGRAARIWISRASEGLRFDRT